MSAWGLCCVTIDFCCEKMTFFLSMYFIGFIGISWSVDLPLVRFLSSIYPKRKEPYRIDKALLREHYMKMKKLTS